MARSSSDEAPPRGAGTAYGCPVRRLGLLGALLLQGLAAQQLVEESHVFS